MPLDATIRSRLDIALAVVDDHGTRGPRLQQEAGRLWNRVRRLLRLSLISPVQDLDALELACLALQLPMKCPAAPAAGGKRAARPNLRDRSEAAAELLVSVSRHTIPDPLLDRATRLLHELPQRNPMLDEARLLADAVNLGDFGVAALVHECVCLGVAGVGAEQLLASATTRDQYGYWDARLKEGFHFDPVRQLARQRLDRARQVLAAIKMELEEDAAP